MRPASIRPVCMRSDCMRIQKLAVITAVLLLSACGGDGGSAGSGSTPAMAPSAGSPAAPGATSPAAPALQSAPAPAEPFNVPPTSLTAMIDGMPFTLIYSVTPSTGTTTFNGQTANSSTVSITVLQQAGTALVTESTTEFYLPNPFTLLGLAGTAGGTAYTLTVATLNPLPSMLTVGAAGTLFSGSYYLSSASAGSSAASGASSDTSTVIGMLTQTYAVTAGTANALTLTIASDGSLNGQSAANSTVFSVDAAGKIVLQSVTVMLNGQAYTFSAPMALSSS